MDAACRVGKIRTDSFSAIYYLFFLKSKRTEAKQLIANSRFEDVNTLLPLPFLRYFFGISSLFPEEIPKKYLQKMLVSPTLFLSLLTSVWVAFFCFFGSENLIGKPLFFMYIIIYLYICKFKQIYNAI